MVVAGMFCALLEASLRVSDTHVDTDTKVWRRDLISVLFICWVDLGGGNCVRYYTALGETGESFALDRHIYHIDLEFNNHTPFHDSPLGSDLFR